jgi:hypothetical protein
VGVSLQLVERESHDIKRPSWLCTLQRFNKKRKATPTLAFWQSWGSTLGIVKGKTLRSRIQCYSLTTGKTISHIYEGAVPYLMPTSYIRHLLSISKCRYVEMCPDSATAPIDTFFTVWMSNLLTISNIAKNLHRKVRVIEVRDPFQQMLMEGAFVSPWANCTSRTFCWDFVI